MALNILHPGKVTETTKATQAEALAGADNRKYMTPLRTKQVVDVVVDDVVDQALPAAIDAAISAASPVFDDVQSVETLAALPQPGTSGILYIVGALAYHWNGTAYDQLGIASTDELSEGTTNLYFTDARAKAALADELSEIGSEISGLNDAIDDEEAARIAGDTALDTKITAETTARTTALAAETTARQTALNAKQNLRTTVSFTLQDGDNYLPVSRNTLFLLSGNFITARINLPTYLPDGSAAWVGDRIRIVWVGAKANPNSRINVQAFAGDGAYLSLAQLHNQDQAAEFVLDPIPRNASGQLTWRADVDPIRWVQPPATPSAFVAANGAAYSPSDVAFDGSHFYIYGKKPDGTPVWLRTPMTATW